MDRLTSKEHGMNTIVLCDSSPGIWDICEGENNIYKIHGFVADKLAAYEDTGLTPEEIETLKHDNARLHALLDWIGSEVCG